MRYTTQMMALALVCVACCCAKNNNSSTDEPVNTKPRHINLSLETIADGAEGGAHQITITAPDVPAVEIPTAAQGWISVQDGTWDKEKYQVTVTLTLAATDAFSLRETEVSVSAAGTTSVSLPVSQAGKAEEAYLTPAANTAEARARELGIGWNMGNHLDAINDGVSAETAWGNPLCTQQTFDGVKAAGFTSVRIPVTWMGHIGGNPAYKLEEKWLNRVYEVVEYAEKAGLKVILNTHHDEDHGDNHWQNLKQAVDDADANERIKKEIEAVWTQIAQKFKDKGDFLVLESFNELIYGNEWYSTKNTEKKCNVINEWNQVFVDAVRATGGNNASRWLGVPGYAASPNFLSYLTLPDDPAGKTMVAFHCYDPYDYTIGDKQLADWGHTGTAYKNGEAEIKALFKSIHDTYVANNIPVYMGEFGCSFRRSSDAKAWAFYKYYLEYVVKAAKTYSIPAFLWDNGAKGTGAEHHAYIDHGTGKYAIPAAQEPVQAMTKAWKTNRSDYTLDSVYNSAPKF